MLGFLSSVLPTIANISPFNQAVKLGFDLLGQKLSNDIGGPAYKSQLPAGTVPINTRTTNITNPSTPGLAICPQKPSKPGRAGGLSFNSSGVSRESAAPAGSDNSAPSILNSAGDLISASVQTDPEPEYDPEHPIGQNLMRRTRQDIVRPPSRRPRQMRQPRQMFNPARDIMSNPNRANWSNQDGQIACAECEI